MVGTSCLKYYNFPKQVYNMMKYVTQNWILNQMKEKPKNNYRNCKNCKLYIIVSADVWSFLPLVVYYIILL